jgi:hypothetical protein
MDMDKLLTNKKYKALAPVVKFLIQEDVMKHVTYLDKFMSALKALVIKPYLRTHYGENIMKILLVRDALSRFPHEKKPNDIPEEVTERYRYHFAAWTLWLQHKNKVYIPLQKVCAIVHEYDLDFDKFCQFIRKHLEKKLYTLVDLAFCEEYISKLFTSSTLQANKQIPYIDNLDQHQNNILQLVVTSRFSILIGGAGVGKTTTVSELIRILLDDPLMSVFCLAFTHKAKHCLQDKLPSTEEYPNLNVMTIHSFILTHKSSSLPTKCFIIVDESSMVDLELMGELANLLLSSESYYQILMVGDHMQLPPIGRAEVFRLAVDQHPNVHKLEHCYRVDKHDLFEAYQDIRNGKLPKKSENVDINIAESDKSTNSLIGKLIYQNYNPSKSQIIAWQNKDVFKINKWVQAMLVKTGQVGPESFKEYYLNDNVVYTGENSETCTNALLGRITKVNTNSIEIAWKNERTSTLTQVQDIGLAYCMTVHKSQGSEYDHVIVPCYDVQKMKGCLDRRWLYTASTRAKKSLKIIATSDIVEFIEQPINNMPVTNIRVV